MARTPKADEPQLYEATTSIASEWIELHALSDFPGGVVRQGTIVRADHPIVKAHANYFEPVRSDVGEGNPPRRRASAPGLPR